MEEASGNCPLFASVFSVKQKTESVEEGVGRVGDLRIGEGVK